MLRVFRRVILLVCVSSLTFACSGSKSASEAPKEVCRATTDCLDGQICQDGACVPGQSCEIEADCSAGQTCISGVCQALPLCDSSADCEAGATCVNGFCRNASCLDGSLTCKSGTHCDRSSGHCVADPVDTDTTEEDSEESLSCTQNIDCGPMMECFEGQCRAVLESDGDDESEAESEQPEGESEPPAELDIDYPIDDSLLCKPCSSDAECGAPNNLCLTDQSGEFFCARYCDETATCPAGYSCTDLPSSLVGNQCQPANLRCLTLDGDADDLCSGGCTATAVDTCMGDSICMCAASYLRLVPCAQVCQHAGYTGADGCAYDDAAQKDACTCSGISDFCVGYLGSDTCCKNDDPCRKAGNDSCECSGFCSWDQADCSATVDGDSSTGQTCAGYTGSDPCCKVDNPCYLRYDSVCQCNGACEWDSYDCENAVDGDSDRDSDSDTSVGCSGSCYSYQDNTCASASKLCTCTSYTWTAEDCQPICTAAGYGQSQGCQIPEGETGAKCICGMLPKTCTADVTVSSFPYQTSGTTSDGTNDLSVEPSCFADYNTVGCDKVYKLTLKAGDVLTAKLDQVGSGYDPALVISGACSTVTPCLAGADAKLDGQDETLTFTAPSDGTYFLSVDSGYGTSNSRGCGAYRLSLSLVQAGVDGDQDSDTTDTDTTDTDTTDRDTVDNDTTDTDTPICTGYTGLFTECCRTGNPCNWSGDSYCDCRALCSWDTTDCTGTKGTCANPIQIASLPYSFSGNTGSLSNLLGISGCDQGGNYSLGDAKGPEQVFQLETRGGHVYRFAVTGASSFDVVLSVRGACTNTPESGSCVAIDDKVTTGETIDISLEDSTDNGYLYVVVDGYSTTSKGAYTLKVTDVTGSK